jgi:hypothetical protein
MCQCRSQNENSSCVTRPAWAIHTPAAILLLVMALMPGCQAEKPLVAKPVPPAPATDACAGNLHELSGLLLEYYLVHRDLPESLDAAIALADALQPVSAICPASGQPYVYSAAGLVAAGESRRVVVMDPQPSHDGGRWALVTVPRDARTPLGLWVVKLSETVAQQYHQPVP